MMDLVPKKHFSELTDLRKEMDRLWNHFFDERPWPASVGIWAPKADIIENKDSLVVKAELPGLSPEDVSICLSGDLLTVKGEKKKEKEEKDEHHYSIERYTGQFQRSFRLPVEVQVDKIEAAFDKGVLSITMPIAEKSQKKAIEIKVK